MYLACKISTNCETIGDLEYEISELKFIGRGNLGIPRMTENSIPLSKKIGLVTEPIIAMKRTLNKTKRSYICGLYIKCWRRRGKGKK